MDKYVGYYFALGALLFILHQNKGYHPSINDMMEFSVFHFQGSEL